MHLKCYNIIYKNKLELKMTSNFNIIINGNKTFYINEGNSNKTSALEKLKTIRFILENKLTYDPTAHDQNSTKSQTEIYEYLVSTSCKICVEYCKSAKNSWFSDEKEVKAVYQDIAAKVDTFKQSCRIFPPLIDDVIPEITKYVDFQGLGRLAQLNHHGKDCSENAMILRAEAFGSDYRDYESATKIMKVLFDDVTSLVHKHLIPYSYSSCLAISLPGLPGTILNTKLNCEQTLKRLKQISTKDLFEIFSEEDAYIIPKNDTTGIVSFKVFRQFISIFTNRNKDDVIDSKTLDKGDRALGISCFYNDEGLVELFLLHGANPNAPFLEHGSLPLHFAAQSGNSKIVELLLNAGVKVDEPGSGGWTALKFACWDPGLYRYKSNPPIKVIELLLQHGADPNIAFSNGSCLLHFAAQAGHSEIVELLLKSGAQANLPGSGGNTPLHFACWVGENSEHKPNPKVVELLLQHDSDPSILNAKGFSPMDFATEGNQTEILKLLVDHDVKTKIS